MCWVLYEKVFFVYMVKFPWQLLLVVWHAIWWQYKFRFVKVKSDHCAEFKETFPLWRLLHLVLKMYVRHSRIENMVISFVVIGDEDLNI